MSDIYSHPESYGLELLIELDRSDQSYCFDMMCVWRRKRDGALLYASDSGCSCPGYYEDTGPEDLERVDAAKIFGIIDDWWRGEFPPSGNLAEKMAFELALRDIIRSQKKPSPKPR